MEKTTKERAKTDWTRYYERKNNVLFHAVSSFTQQFTAKIIIDTAKLCSAYSHTSISILELGGGGKLLC